MRFLIYGAGALGQAIGCMLAAGGYRVDLVIRRRYIDILQEKGLRVSGVFGDYTAPMENVTLLDGVEGASGQKYDFILLTTKAYDTAESVADIATLLDNGCPVVSMQNGCGNIEKLIASLGEERSFGARVITGFEINSPGEIAITVSADDIHVGWCHPGEVHGDALRLAQTLSAAGLPCIAVADVHKSLFAKLLYNCSLNPLGAILGVHYGLLGESVETRKIIDSVIDETFKVIGAMGGSTPWHSADEYRKMFYETLLPATYNHRPSMLQDIENGKPTEVDALVGYVVVQGEKYNVATPTCGVLASLVRFKENKVRQ